MSTAIDNDLLAELEQARAAILAERAAAQDVVGKVGAKVKHLRRRKLGLEQEIKAALKAAGRTGGEVDVSALRAEQAEVGQALDDELVILEAAKGRVTLTFEGPDGSAALLERYRPAIVELARAQSADAAAALAEVQMVFQRFTAAYAIAAKTWREAWAIGPGRPGHRFEELAHTGGMIGDDHSRAVVGFDSRVLGGSAWDAVQLEMSDFTTSGGARHRAGGSKWVKPFALVAAVLEQVRGHDCLPASAVRDPAVAGEPGRYRTATEGQGITLDAQALQHERQRAIGEDGFSPLRFERPLTESDHVNLEINRAEHGFTLPEPGPPATVPISDAGPLDVVEVDVSDWVDHGDGIWEPPEGTSTDVSAEGEVIARGNSTLGPKERPGYPGFRDA